MLTEDYQPDKDVRSVSRRDCAGAPRRKVVHRPKGIRSPATRTSHEPCGAVSERSQLSAPSEPAYSARPSHILSRPLLARVAVDDSDGLSTRCVEVLTIRVQVDDDTCAATNRCPSSPKAQAPPKTHQTCVVVLTSTTSFNPCRALRPDSHNCHHRFLQVTVFAGVGLAAPTEWPSPPNRLLVVSWLRVTNENHCSQSLVKQSAVAQSLCQAQGLHGTSHAG